MKLHLSNAAFAVWLVLCTACVAAQPKANTLVGSYDFCSGTAPKDICISVTISREGASYALGYEGAHPDGHGAAPEGGGTGRIGPDGTLRFSYEDAFSNRGSGTFRRTSHGYELSINISDVSDSRCLSFYGTTVLQRVTRKR